MNRKQYVLEAIGQEDKIYDYRGGKLDKTMPVPRQQDAEGNFVDDYVQPVLSAAGLFPVFGNFFDLANAGIDVAQGQLGDAGLNVLAAVPGFGQFVTGTKLGAKAVGALGKAEKPVTALARASKSKPAVAASVVGPFAPDVYNYMTNTTQGTDGSGRVECLRNNIKKLEIMLYQEIDLGAVLLHPEHYRHSEDSTGNH